MNNRENLMDENNIPLRTVITKELLKAVNNVQDKGQKTNFKVTKLGETANFSAAIGGYEASDVVNMTVVKAVLDVLDKFHLLEEKEAEDGQLTAALIGIAYNLSQAVSNMTGGSYDVEDDEEE